MEETREGAEGPRGRGWGAGGLQGPGSGAARHPLRLQGRRGRARPGFPCSPVRARRVHTAPHPPHTHPGGRAGLEVTQACLADIFLWEDFKRAVKARNYTGYKLRNPERDRGPFPPRIRPRLLGASPAHPQEAKRTRQWRDHHLGTQGLARCPMAIRIGTPPGLAGTG